MKSKLAVFTVEKLKFDMGTHLDNPLANRDIAKASDLASLEINVEETDTRHSDLCKSITLSTKTATR